MNFLTIEVPIPPRSLSPNGRAHYMVKARDRKKQRRAAGYAALSAIGRDVRPRWAAADVSVVWYAKTRRWPDADNAIGSLKGAIDGLVDAGALLDDDRLTWLPIEFQKDDKRPRVEITLTPSANRVCSSNDAALQPHVNN